MCASGTCAAMLGCSALLAARPGLPSGATNTTWLRAEPWDPAGEGIVVFGMRIGALIGSGDCMSPTGQTQPCHSPAGPMRAAGSSPGTWLAAYGYGDGVAHSHFHRATYWIKDVNVAGTP